MSDPDVASPVALAPGISSPTPIAITRLPIRFESDASRVITLPFMVHGSHRVRTLFERLETLDEAVVGDNLARVLAGYEHRHRDVRSAFREHYVMAATSIGWTDDWDDARRLLAGSYLTMEYAIESAALFNPSIVPLPDQTGVPEGGLRFIMSLRAVGEGHVSSVVFRSGTILADHTMVMDRPARHIHRSRIAPDRSYLKELFRRKLQEMSVPMEVVDIVLDAVPERFTLAQLHEAVEHTMPLHEPIIDAQTVVGSMLWLAQSNYHVTLMPDADVSEMVIFPMSASESRGIEDLRLVRFVEDDGAVTYYGTYTAYGGEHTLPMLVQTRDFRRIDVHSLNGACAMGKGMALFPRRIGGHYVMCSRGDGENLYIMYSDYVHFWESAHPLAKPRHPWELMQIGNCGSPLETSEGWLLLTHGVGPMRTYCLGAMLLDRDDPTRIRGHLREPLLGPVGEEREGYVPNVVYTCGALIHQDRLYLPYALADKSTAIAMLQVDELLNRLLDSPP